MNRSSRSIGSLGARLVDQERGEQEHAADQRAAHRRVRPAQPRLLDQREHRTAETQHAQHRTDHVNPALRGVAGRLQGPPWDQPQARDHQRHVDHEDPPPRRDVQDHSGDERAERPGDRSPCRPGADRRAALLAPGTSRRSPPANSASAARRRPLGARETRPAARSSAPPRTAAKPRRSRPPRARTPAAPRRCRQATRRAGSANRASAGTHCVTHC